MGLFSSFYRSQKLILSTMTASMLLSACSVVGVRSGTEQPPYSLLGNIGSNVELRQYQDRLSARVEINNKENETSQQNAAFTILADYIFGGNRAKDKLAMTAPVSMQKNSKIIAMTAPVAANTTRADSYSMSFFLPRTITLENAPIPDDDRVELLEVPAKIMAALRFTGNRGEQRVNEFKAQLIQAINLSKWQVLGEPVAYFYDPPWTLPSLRRNEVAVAVGLRSTN